MASTFAGATPVMVTHPIVKHLIFCGRLFCVYLFLQVYSILRHCAEILGYETDRQLEELYEKTAWYFDEKYKSPGSSFDAFKLAVG